MKESTLIKIARVKSFLDKKGLFYTEYANGHLKIGATNLWCTSEKWSCGSTGISGNGVNSFVNHVTNK